MNNAPSIPQPKNAWLWASWTLAVREIVRFLRQRSRVTGAIGQPILFWILFGAGLAGSFQFGGTGEQSGISFQEYFLPGVAVLIVLFTSIFTSISVIQDRNEGFLQGVLVAPVPRSSIVMGKVLGGTALALLQAFLFILIAPLLQFVGLAPPMNLSVSPLVLLGAVLFLTLISLGLTALGYFFAWKIDSTQGYHAVMSLVLLPMWLLSGAFFPGTGSVWLSLLIRLNPLTYGVAGLRRVLNSSNAGMESLPPFWLCLTVTTAFALGMLAVDVWITRHDQAIK
ncbi:ABC transporter permease [Planctomicrobium piriforme]|uniref:Transport permease protein n=1 Tax=Planctomicrobium piriforme TaxID=1576369 RepID=A0A1I3CZ14_9PLAN|nr:ABC transporter permease [Planctomicrobium piriforme]SFH79705.1 ABC-2 type transport system permease protein [Planctomicrobium piriforme]